jgi:hypothetical protein
MKARGELSPTDKTNGGNAQGTRMESQWTAAKKPGAELVLDEQKIYVSPGRNAYYEPILRKNKRISSTSHGTSSNTRRGGSAVLIKDNMINHEEAKYATDEIQAQ